MNLNIEFYVIVENKSFSCFIHFGKLGIDLILILFHAFGEEN